MVLEPTETELLEIGVYGDNFLGIAIQQTDGPSSGSSYAEGSPTLQAQSGDLGP